MVLILTFKLVQGQSVLVDVEERALQIGEQSWFDFLLGAI